MNDDASITRTHTANQKLARALRKAGAKISKLDLSSMREVNGVRVFMSFATGFGMKQPTPLRFSFGPRWGKRQPTLREPKLGYSYALLADRVLTYVREERARLDAKKVEEAIRTANQRLAVKLTNAHKLRTTSISVRSYWGAPRAGLVNLEVHLEDLTEAKANKIIRALKRLVPPIKT